MDILNRILVSLSSASLLALAGCYADFEPDMQSTPVLCMNSLITAGDTVTVSLTRSWRWSEGVPGENLDIEVADATVTLTSNGGHPVALRPVTITEWVTGRLEKRLIYVADYVAAEGDELRLEASSPAWGDASAQVTVPVATPVDSVALTSESTVIPGTDYWPERYSIRASARVWFRDPAPTTDYYLFMTNGNTVQRKEADGNTSSWSTLSFYDIDYTGEPLFSEHMSALESAMGGNYGYTMFSDRQISGKSYPLNIVYQNLYWEIDNATGVPIEEDPTLDITLYTISESYYRHLLSVWQSNDGIAGSLGGVGLADPVWEASNVSTGAGVVAARAASRVRIPASRLL